MATDVFTFIRLIKNEASIWDVCWVIIYSLIITTTKVMMISAKIPTQVGNLYFVTAYY